MSWCIFYFFFYVFVQWRRWSKFKTSTYTVYAIELTTFSDFRQSRDTHNRLSVLIGIISCNYTYNITIPILCVGRCSRKTICNSCNCVIVTTVSDCLKSTTIVCNIIITRDFKKQFFEFYDSKCDEEFITYTKNYSFSKINVLFSLGK